MAALSFSLIFLVSLSNPDYNDPAYWQAVADKTIASLATEVHSSLSTVKLKQLIETGRFQSVDQLLAAIKADHPSTVQNPPLQLYTRAINHADPLHPRPLHASPNGQTYFAYSTHPMDPSYNSIEIIEYNIAGLIADPKAPPSRAFEIRLENSKLAMHSETDRCISCHARKPNDAQTLMPLWTGYPYWERSAEGIRVVEHDSAIREKMDRMNQGIQASESNRIQNILPLPSGDNHLDEFTRKINTWALFVLARKASAHPEFNRFVDALKVAVEIADAQNDYFQGHSQDPHRVATAFGPFADEYLSRYRQLKSEYEESLEIHFDGHTRALDQIFGEKVSEMVSDQMVTDFQNPTIQQTELPFFEFRKLKHANQAAIIGAALSFVGIDLRDFSTQPTRSAPYLAGGTYFEMRPLLWMLDPDVKPGSDQSGKLAEWTERSRASLNQFQPAAMPIRPQWPVPLMLKTDCSSCHQSNNLSAAPEIPFGDEAEFKGRLTPALAQRVLKAVESHRMPKYFPRWNSVEIRDLDAYLNEILILKSVKPEQACPSP